MFKRVGLHFFLICVLWGGPIPAQAGPLQICKRVWGVAYSTFRGIKDRIDLFTGGATSHLSSEQYEVFQKAYHDPKYEPTAEETLVLRGNGKKSRDVTDLYRRYRDAHALVKAMNQVMGIAARSAPPRARLVTWDQIKDTAQGLFSFPTLSRRYRAQDIYQKILRSPKQDLSAEDAARIKSLKLEKDLEDFRQEVITNGGKPEWLERNGLALMWGKEFLGHFKEAGRIAVQVPYGIGRTLIVPLPRMFVNHQIRKIYEKVARDPNYQLTEPENRILRFFNITNERKLVERYNFEQDLERFRKDVKIHGEAFARINQLKRFGDYTMWFLAMAAMGGLNFGHENITTEESFDEDDEDGMSKYDEKVEIIMTSPVPHASLRIGGIVYNYGQFRVQRMNLHSYRESVGFGPEASGSHTRIELNMTKDEARKLREILERDVGNYYGLIFPFNDCISQTNRAVEEAIGLNVPPVMDRSGAGTLAYYKGLKAMGSDRVGKIRYAALDGRTVEKRAQESIANGLDSLFFLGHSGKVFIAGPLWDTFVPTYEPRGSIAPPDRD